VGLVVFLEDDERRVYGFGFVEIEIFWCISGRGVKNS
jgi:hypothetical protein